MLKVGTPIEASIWTKLMAHSSVESMSQGKKPSSTIFYHSGGRYFRKCLLEQLSNEYKPLDIPKGSEINFAGIFSSSLFHWFWLLTSDCYHVTRPIILQFRVPATLIFDDSLAQISKRFLDDIWAKSKKTEHKRKDSSIKEEYNFSIGKSKPIIDEIDQVLARHYGFTDAELDFIIHYDIKYRMGEDADSDDEADRE